ncbi:MAG TPA: hypothetical protein VGK38_12435 [Prolixibacteraceae bacterium]|jgi:hypothetical protein
MKRLLLFPILFLSLISFSQENWETTFKGGINCSFVGSSFSSSGSKIFLGATAGLEQTYYFDNSLFSVQSGLEYENLGLGISSFGVTVGNSNPGDGTLSRSNANYLSVPLHLRCQVSEHWGVLAGAAYRFGLNHQQMSYNTYKDDICLDAGIFYKMKNMRFNLIYQHGLREENTGSQTIQAKNRTITFTVSTAFWNK